MVMPRWEDFEDTPPLPQITPWAAARQTARAEALVSKIRGEKPPPPVEEEEEETWWEKARAPWWEPGEFLPELAGAFAAGRPFKPAEPPPVSWGTEAEWRVSPEPEWRAYEPPLSVGTVPEPTGLTYEELQELWDLKGLPPEALPERGEAGWRYKVQFPGEARTAEDIADIYASQPAKEVPEGAGLEWFDRRDALGKLVNAYYSVYADEEGNVLSLDEVKRLARTEPNAFVKQVWFTGGRGEFNATEGFFFARDLLSAEEKQAALKEEQMIAPMRERAEERGKLEAEEAKILDSDMDSATKLSAMIKLWLEQGKGREGPGGMSQGELGALRTKVSESMTPEQLKEEALARAKQWEEPEPEIPGWKAPEVVDVGELTKQIAPFGISVMPDYPYLSPISEAHLRRLPQPVLEMMFKYLAEKGIAWRDWLALSMGAGAAPGRMPAWGTVRQF